MSALQFSFSSPFNLILTGIEPDKPDSSQLKRTCEPRRQDFSRSIVPQSFLSAIHKYQRFVWRDLRAGVSAGAHKIEIHIFKENTMQTTNIRSNRHIFTPENTGSPKDGLFTHISSLGQLARLDFEYFNVAGDVIFKVEGDAFPTSQEDEEARVGSLAYAIKKLSSEVDAAEFVRCLNAICDGGDARIRQATASHYYSEMAERGVNIVIKEMALLAMQLAEYAIVEAEEEVGCFSLAAQSSNEINRDREAALREGRKSLFEQELDSVKRLVSGNRSAS